MSDRIPQTNGFKAKMKIGTNCCCECCHGIGKVIVVTMPNTLFHDKRNLSTKYIDWWMCEECFETFKKTLNEAEVDWGE